MLNPTGTALIWSTYVGANPANPGGGNIGLANASGAGIAIDATGAVYITGQQNENRVDRR